MYHIAIISENRILLKQVYEMLEDNSLFRIHIVPFSMDAYEEFYQNHIDIVILDTSVFLSYDNILEQFKQCQWHYHVLLLHEGEPDFATKPNIYWLDKDRLSKELFHEILIDIQNHNDNVRKENSTLTLEWDGTHTFSIHPDAYHLILVKCLGVTCHIDSDLCNCFISKSSVLCKINIIFNNSREILCYISRSDIREPFNFAVLSQSILQIFGTHTAILYQKNINWKKFNQACQDMKDHQSYCYFLSGKIYQLPEINKPQTYGYMKDLQKQCSQLLPALLNNDSLSARHILQDLYLHTIKSSFQFGFLEYIRIQLQFFYFLLSKETPNYIYLSIEDELDGILQTNLFHYNSYPSDRIQEIIVSTTLTIYNQYHTNISLEGIAKELSLNKIYLNRIFKEHFGLTVLETLQILRLLHAKYYLIHSDKKVAEIAQETGFTDAGYFSKFFKKATGYTALEFRMKREDEKEMKNQYAGIMAI